MSATANPCTSCGACCATFRVTFYRCELDTEPGGWVPAEFTEMLDERGIAMRRTDDAPRRCVALRGDIGKGVGCAIYEHRPSPCRCFAPEAGIGRGDIHCADARRLHGLPPLRGSYDGAVLA